MQPKEFFCSHASTPVFSGATLEAHAWMAMEHSHLLPGRTGLSVSSLCTPGGRLTAKKVVVEWQNTGRRGFGVLRDALELKVFEVEVRKNCFFKIIWGLTSGAHWGICSVGGSPCIITRKPEQQIARLLSSSLFVARCCHYLLLIPQTVPSAPPTCVLTPSPSTTQGTRTKFAFSLWSKNSISRASRGLGH